MIEFGAVPQVKGKFKEGVTDEKDVDFNTPVHWAAVKGKSDVVEFLLEKGFPPDEKNKDGDTPLYPPCPPVPLIRATSLMGDGPRQPLGSIGRIPRRCGSASEEECESVAEERGQHHAAALCMRRGQVRSCETARGTGGTRESSSSSSSSFSSMIDVPHCCY